MKVLITGTARGIGRACALKYLAEGHEVFGFDIRESTILADRYMLIMRGSSWMEMRMTAA